MPWREWLERGIGASFCLAGVAKFLPFAEDPEVVFAKMVIANQGTELASMSQMLAENSQIVSYFVGLAMIASGATQVFQLSVRSFATLGQIAMIIGFVTLLHRAFPGVLLDGFYLLGFALIWLRFFEKGQPTHA